MSSASACTVQDIVRRGSWTARLQPHSIDSKLPSRAVFGQTGKDRTAGPALKGLGRDRLPRLFVRKLLGVPTATVRQLAFSRVKL